MTTTPLISIIVPVYNAEKYLKQCVDSIIAQTFTDWELLLIDDGSTDSSPAICDLYAQQDTRIRVFHKNNGGVSSARNWGIEKSIGQWLTFLDSDDYLGLIYIQEVVSLIKKDEKNMGLLWTNHVNVNNDCSFISYNIKNCKYNSYVDVLRLFCEQNLLRYVTCWAKFYNRNLIISNSVYFHEQIDHHEDFCFVLDYLFVCCREKLNLSLQYLPFLFHLCGRGDSLSAKKIDLENGVRIIGLLNKTISKWNNGGEMTKQQRSELYRTLYVRAFQLMSQIDSFQDLVELRQIVVPVLKGIVPLEKRNKAKWILFFLLPAPISYCTLRLINKVCRK